MCIRDSPCADLLAQYLGDCPNLELSFQEIGENRKNLIATLKGTGEKKAILLNGHLDVVPVGERANWKYDPFGAQIVDGKMCIRDRLSVRYFFTAGIRPIQNISFYLRAALAAAVDDNHGGNHT